MKGFALLLVVALSNSLMPANAQSKDPTPRVGQSPSDRAKIKRAEAQFRRGLGIRQSPQDSSAQGRPGEQRCSTNVGNTYVEQMPGARNSKPKSDNIVVVNGDVINVCR